MNWVFRFLVLNLWAAFVAPSAGAQELSALARLDAERSFVADSRHGVEIDLQLTQAVPYRVFTLTEPARLVADFREVDWSGVSRDSLLESRRVKDLRFGTFKPGWSRMVVELDGAFVVKTAGLKTNDETGEALMQIRLEAASFEDFADQSGAPEGALWADPEAPAPATVRGTRGQGPLVVVLDPGHGGIDPGAEREAVSEALLMMTFARELKEVLLRSGGFEVVLTRNEDVFVPLETRVSLAREAGADVFISLHADALAEGRAHGATVYTLSDTASDEASQKLAERHDRADLLAGVDLNGQDDVIATVLMDLARTETAPRSEALADHIVAGLRGGVGDMHKRPRLRAGFSVLKAPDMPSILIELGFMSSPRDFENLNSAEWRLRAARGIRTGLEAWVLQDAANAELLRR